MTSLASSHHCSGGRATQEQASGGRATQERADAFWQNWGMRAVALTLYVSAGTFIKAFLPLQTYPLKLFSILEAHNAGDHAEAARRAATFFQQATCCLDTCSRNIRRVVQNSRRMLSADFLTFLQNVADTLVLGNAQVERDHSHNMHVNAMSGGKRLGRHITLERLRCQSFLDSWKAEHMKRGGEDPNMLTRSAWESYGVLTRRVRKSTSKRKGIGGNAKLFYANYHMRNKLLHTPDARQTRQAELFAEYDALSAEAKLIWQQRFRRQADERLRQSREEHGGGRASPFASVWGAGSQRWPVSPEVLTSFAQGRGFTKLGHELKTEFVEEGLIDSDVDDDTAAQPARRTTKTCCHRFPGICASVVGDRLSEVRAIVGSMHAILCAMPQEQALGSVWRLTAGRTLDDEEIALCIIVCWLRYRPRLAVLGLCAVLTDPSEMEEATAWATALMQLTPDCHTGVAFRTSFAAVWDLLRQVPAGHTPRVKMHRLSAKLQGTHLNQFIVRVDDHEPVSLTAAQTTTQRSNRVDPFDLAVLRSEMFPASRRLVFHGGVSLPRSHRLTQTTQAAHSPAHQGHAKHTGPSVIISYHQNLFRRMHVLRMLQACRVVRMRAQNY